VPISTDQIVALYHQRKKLMDPRVARMIEVRDAVNGDIVVPLPELDRSERPMVANLIDSGLNQHAMRIASTMPDVRCQPLRPGIAASEAKANDRRAAILGWWSMNKLGIIQRRRARFFVGYAMAPVVIRAQPINPSARKRDVPIWQWRDPLTTFPPPGEELDPPDCLFAFAKTLRWLRAEYPAAATVLARRDASPDDRITVVEYVDDEVNVLAALAASGGESDPLNPSAAPAGLPFIELARDDNRAGICTAVVPGRICLDRRAGQFDGLVGLYWWQSKIMALEGIAMERDIFPDEWFIGRPGENPQIITAADGRAGIIGEASGGMFDRPGAQSNIPAYQTLDRIERSMRLTGGIPAELGGESASNIRTGRRGGQVLSSAIDFSIQEAQQVFEASLEEENVRAVAIDKAYFGNRKKAFYYSWNGKAGRGDYTPNDTWETDENTVSYSFAGADMNQLTVATGQLIGMELMSHHRGMELNPMVEDPDAEERAILAEKLEAASISGFQSGLADGTIPIADGARVYELVVAKHRTFYEAVAQAQREAQERQASAGPPGAPEGPVPPGAPEAQPGLAAPGMGAEAPEAIPAGAPSLANLSQMLTTLRRPNTQATV
jgi:hypothetical protein